MDTLSSIIAFIANDVRAGLEFINQLWCWPIVFFAAINFTRIEIAAEGKNGWAFKMPTYYQFSGFFGRFYRFISGGKPATGYHVPMNQFMACVFYFAAGTHFFAGILAFIIVGLAEDFMWFMLNPDFGWEKFRRGSIWWHGNMAWVGRVPRYYITSVVASITIAALLGSFTSMAIFTAKVAAATIFTSIMIAPAYRRWYRKKIEHDERARMSLYDLFPGS